MKANCGLTQNIQPANDFSNVAMCVMRPLVTFS